MATSDHIFSDLDFIDDVSVRAEAVAALLDRLTNAPVEASRALAGFVPDADEYQQRVIDARDTTLRMVAPAGSGKTQTIVNRAFARIRDGMRPSRLLILTFDNAAALSLKEKLTNQLDQLAAGETGSFRELVPSTLNAFGYRLLRDHFPEEHLQIIQDGRSHRFARDAIAALREKSARHHAVLPGNLRSGVYLDFFGLLKNNLFDPRQIESQVLAEFIMDAPQSEPMFSDASTPEKVMTAVQALVWLFQSYDQRLQAQRLMDFDDQKLRPYALIAESRPVLSAIQGSYDEVIVDEFQDINRLDFELIRLISLKAALTVTGDDDQAIYGFRGCSPDYIINLDRHLERSVNSYELQINYRCPPNIVSHADQLIRHNKVRIPKEPIAARTDPSLIKVIATQAAGVEARGTVEFIRRVLRAQPALEYNDFAVLYRTNAQSLPLQVEFVLNDIPYTVRRADNIVSNDALARLLALLRVQLALARDRQPTIDDQVLAIASYFRWLTAPQQTEVRNALVEVGDFETTLRSAALSSAVPKVGQSKMGEAFDTLLGASSLLKTLEVIADRFHGVSGMVGSLEDALDQRVPLGEVFELANHFGGSTSQFVSTMEQALDRARKGHAGEDESGVALLTYFKSKGRQWHTVILTTCNEGLIPHRRADIEDERRLFYVALTRASANLVISYVSSALGKRIAPSRFLHEAGLL